MVISLALGGRTVLATLWCKGLRVVAFDGKKAGLDRLDDPARPVAGDEQGIPEPAEAHVHHAAQPGQGAQPTP